MSAILKHFTPYITPLIVFISLEWLFAKPASGWTFLVFIFVLVIASFIFLSGKKLGKKGIRFLLPSFLFLVSFLLFFTFLVLASSSFKHLFALLIVLLLMGVLKVNLKFFQIQDANKSYSNFFSYLNLATIFMFFASLGSASTFLAANPWLLFFLATLFFLIIFYSNYHSRRFLRDNILGQNDLTEILDEKIGSLIAANKSQRIFFILVPSLILVEIFWSLSFLPTSFYVNSLILTICYYIVSGLIASRLNNNLSSKIIQKYVLVGGFCLLLILLTARI